MKRTLYFFGAAIVAIAAAGTLSGCAAAGGTASAATAPLEQHTITVDSVPAAEEDGLYVAQAQGFFAQQGLTVKIDTVTGGEAAIPGLQAGRAQLVAGNYVSFILAQMTGHFARKPVSMRIIAAGSEMTPGTEDLYVMPHSKYQTVAELAKAHARIGLNTGNDIGDVMVGALLAQAGYHLSSIRQVTPAGGFPALEKMLPAGQVAVGADAPEYGDRLPAALNAGQQLADTDRSAVETAMEKYMDISPLVADTMAIDTYPLEIDVPQLQRVADSMFEFGLTPNARAPYQISNMIQPEPGLVR
jgi:NitT/TauT family transport system substrate-binding protein